MTYAPELQVSRWFNTADPLTLGSLRGRVVALHAFQMLCPGCVQGGIPQAQRMARLFDPSHVQVLGLHTVFEHHAVMTQEALAVFLREYRITFPVGVDQPAEHGALPLTMKAYAMEGRPTLVLLDREGRVRRQVLGVEDDIVVGAAIGALLA